MSNNTETVTKHSDRMKKLLEALSTTASALAKKLEYKGHGSIYGIIYDDGRKITPPMIERIINKYPKVNKKFLTHGEYPVIISDIDALTQMNLLGKSNPDKEIIEVIFLKKLDIKVEKLDQKIDKLTELLKEVLGKE